MMPARSSVADGALALSWRRVTALVLRYLYLLKGSWPRIFECFFSQR